MSLTCNARLTRESTELIFVKAVPLPETLMNFTWSLVSYFLVTPSTKLVATAIVLAAAATLCLVLCLLFKPIEEKSTATESSTIDPIEMMNISSINKSRKSSICHEPAATKPENASACDSPYAAYVGDLFIERLQNFVPRSTSPYAIIYLGKLFSGTFESAEPSSLPYEVYLGDLFQEQAQTSAAPVRRMSYADAVGYSQIGVRRPRNPDAVCYDVYLGHLFAEQEPSIKENKEPPTIQSAHVNARKIMAYADAVGYDHMEVKFPRKSPSVYYDVYLGDLFAEPERPSDQQKGTIEWDNIQLIFTMINLLQLNIKYYSMYIWAYEINNE